LREREGKLFKDGFVICNGDLINAPLRNSDLIQVYKVAKGSGE
jgi:hypothetical protein